MRGDDEIFHDLLFLRLDEAIVDLDPPHLALAGKAHADKPATRDALDLQLVELCLHGFHLGLELSRLLHQAEEVCHVTTPVQRAEIASSYRIHRTAAPDSL